MLFGFVYINHFFTPGIGIPPDQLKTIFKAFSGVNQTMTRAADGLGLGLGIILQLSVS